MTSERVAPAVNRLIAVDPLVKLSQTVECVTPAVGRFIFVEKVAAGQ